MILNDRAEPTNVRLTKDGYLVGEARVARTGIQVYTGDELGRPDLEKVRVFRPEDEVFNADAMASYAYRPVTVDHPPEQVTADNWKDFARGQTGADVARDGDTIRVPMVLMDAKAIREWRDGKRELSMGYSSEIEFTDGVTPDGEQYDAIQRQMKMNHLAIVARARGGSKLRLGDADDEETPMTDKLKTITVDGLSVETTDAGAQAIDKLQAQLADEQSKTASAADVHDKAIAAKDAELAKKDAEIEELKGKVMSDEDLAKAVADRAELIGKAKQIKDQDYTGSAPDIRKAAVVAALGDEVIKDKSDAYIEARFDTLLEAAEGSNPVRDALRGRQPVGDADKAYNDHNNYLENAWKGDQKEAH